MNPDYMKKYHIKVFNKVEDIVQHLNDKFVNL